MKKTILNFVAAAMFVAASLPAHAQGFVYDQQSATAAVSIIGNGNADGLNIQEDSPLTQSFVPTLSAISFVQFEFWDIPNNGNNGATVYVNLWTGSPNINSATFISSTTPVYMPNGFMNSGLATAGVTNFYFSTAINLIAGQTYYLQPVVLSGDDPWDIITIGDTYSNGQLYGGAGGFTAPFQPSTDLWFREGVVAAPEPTTLAFAGVGGILALVLRRRSKLFISFGIGALLLCSTHAQTNSDSVVQVTADIAGLTPVTAASLPSASTFLVLHWDIRELLFVPGQFAGFSDNFFRVNLQCQADSQQGVQCRDSQFLFNKTNCLAGQSGFLGNQIERKPAFCPFFLQKTGDLRAYGFRCFADRHAKAIHEKRLTNDATLVA